MPVVASRVQHSKDDYGVCPDNIEDPIGKTSCESAANLRAFANPQKRPRMLKRPQDGRSDFVSKFQPQPLSPAFIPSRRF